MADRDPTRPPDPTPKHTEALRDAIQSLRDAISTIPHSLSSAMSNIGRAVAASAGGSVGNPRDADDDYTSHAPNSEAARQFRESRKYLDAMGQILRDARENSSKPFTNETEYRAKDRATDDAIRRHAEAEKAYREARSKLAATPAEGRGFGQIGNVVKGLASGIRDAMAPRRPLFAGLPTAMTPDRPDPDRHRVAAERVREAKEQHDSYEELLRNARRRRDASLSHPDHNVYENLDVDVKQIEIRQRRAKDRLDKERQQLANLPPTTFRESVSRAFGTGRERIGAGFRGAMGNARETWDAVSGSIEDAARGSVRNWKAAFHNAAQRIPKPRVAGNLLEELSGFKAVPKAVYDSLDATYGAMARAIYNTRPVQQAVIAKRMFNRAARGGWTPVPITGLPAFGARAGHAFRRGVQGAKSRFGRFGPTVRRVWNAPRHAGQVFGAVARGRASPLPNRPGRSAFGNAVATGISGLGASFGNLAHSAMGLFNPMMALKTATVAAVVGLNRMSDSMAESNARFQGFSAQYNYQLAQLHMGDFNRAIKFSQATEDTATELLKANNALRNARLPLEIAWNNLTNRAMTHGTNFLAGFAGGLGGGLTPEGGFKGTSLVDMFSNAKNNVGQGNIVQGIGQILGEMPSATLGGVPLTGIGMLVSAVEGLSSIGANIELMVAKLVGTNADIAAAQKKVDDIKNKDKEDMALPLDEFTRAMGGGRFVGPGGMVPLPGAANPVAAAAAGGFAGGLPMAKPPGGGWLP